MNLKVKLTEGQFDRLKIHAEEKKRPPEEDLVTVWWGRMQALDKYADKLVLKEATFRAYAPRGLPDDEREKIKKLALAEGLAPAVKKVKVKKERSSSGKKPALQAEKAGSTPARSTKVVKPGKKHIYKIDLYDSPPVAKSKASSLAEAQGTTIKEVLHAAGRDATGKLVKR